MKRLEELDVAKGIGIILVVWAHARAPFTAYIYQFHMPLFFLISGYLYSSRGSIKDFIIKKLRGLYIPFVFWNLMIFLIKNMDNFIKSTKAFIQGGFEIALAIEKDGQFFGATWFLGILLYISIFYKILDTWIDSKYKRIIITVCFYIGTTIGFCIDLPYMLSRGLVLGSFFALGAFVKEYKVIFVKMDSIWTALFCFVGFAVIGHSNYANMGANDYSSPILFVVGALMASYFVVYISKKIVCSKTYIFIAVKMILCFLGKRSMDIVIWQFVVFRIVIAMQLLMDNVPLTEILSYYPVYETNHGWWLIYTIVGVAGSIVWCNFLRFGPWGKILSKIGAV